MSIRDIIVLLDDGKSNAERVDFAIGLAKAHAAHLTGIALGSMKPIHAPRYKDEKAVARMSEKMAQKIIEEFAIKAKGFGVKTETLIIYGDATSSGLKMAHYARNYDLAILTQPHPERDNYNPLIEFSKQVLLHSGRPIIFMPYIGANRIPPQTAMIAWDGTPAVSRSVHDAIPLLKSLQDVTILVVASKKQQQSKKEVLVNGLARHLEHHGVNARILNIDPGANSVSSVILNQITDNNIDLLIMGGHGTPTLKQKILGTVTHNLLSSMIVPVLMSD